MAGYDIPRTYHSAGSDYSDLANRANPRDDRDLGGLAKSFTCPLKLMLK